MLKSRQKRYSLLLVLIFTLMMAFTALAAPGDTHRVSEGTTEANAISYSSDITADGQYIVFASLASNLVEGDTNAVADIFLRNTQTGTTTRISMATGSAEADGESERPVISANGRYIAFESDATNLVSSDSNGQSDVFIYDTQTDTTTRISVGAGGVEGNGRSVKAAISASGQYVAFYSSATTLVAGDVNGKEDVFVHDLQASTTHLISTATNGTQGNGDSSFPTISADGRYVAFSSGADNLVSGDGNSATDIFIHDRQTNTTSRVSMDRFGGDGDGYANSPDISADGRHVAFDSDSTDLVLDDNNGMNDVFVRDMQTDTTTMVSVASGGVQGNGRSYSPSISADGRVVAFKSEVGLSGYDTNALYDIYLHDTLTNQTLYVSHPIGDGAANSYSSNPVVSDNGRYTTYQSDASNLVTIDTNDQRDIFVYDRETAVNIPVSIASNGAEGDGASHGYPDISADGRYVAFHSSATNLVADDTNFSPDIFVRDTQTGAVKRVSVHSDGTPGNVQSYNDPSISENGKYVAFRSLASNLIDNDTNAERDIFVHNLHNGITDRVSVATGGTEANDSSQNPAISADGRYVAFKSDATNLVSGDNNGIADIFVRDRQLGTTVRVSVATDGTEANNIIFDPEISTDGRYVVFTSLADNLVSGDTNGSYDVFLHDLQTNATTRVSVASDGSEGDNNSNFSNISSNGRYVVFSSSATNLAPNDTNNNGDIFIHDIQTGMTNRGSLANSGAEADDSSLYPSISSDGRYVAFLSHATNLVSGDTNGEPDLFVRDTVDATTVHVSRASDGAYGNNSPYNPAISGNGRFVTYSSSATNLVNGDTNGVTDVFIHEVTSPESYTVYLPLVIR